MPTPLTELRVAGFRSLKDVSLTLGPVTVLIGPNGSGKSNVLTVLKLIPLLRKQSLRSFVARAGGASRLLHYGPQVTTAMRIALHLSAGEASWSYRTDLEYSPGDALTIVNEAVFAGADRETSWSYRAGDMPAVVDEASLAKMPILFGSNVPESVLGAYLLNPSLDDPKGLIDGMGFFHFHDTSTTSPLRQNASQADSKHLRSDGANLAAYLYRLKRSASDDGRAAWTLLEGVVRRVAPYIKGLEPDLIAPDSPDSSAVRLYWTDERDHRFDVHDLSDGTLRAIALFAALTQPPATRPTFLTIDEPELGLHPAALALFAALVRSASAHSQILLATQSPALLDEFTPEEIVVAERDRGETVLKRLDPEQLAGWLDAYSLSELYDKNVLGGRP